MVDLKLGFLDKVLIQQAFHIPISYVLYIYSHHVQKVDGNCVVVVCSICLRAGCLRVECPTLLQWTARISYFQFDQVLGGDYTVLQYSNSDNIIILFASPPTRSYPQFPGNNMNNMVILIAGPPTGIYPRFPGGRKGSIHAETSGGGKRSPCSTTSSWSWLHKQRQRRKQSAQSGD